TAGAETIAVTWDASESGDKVLGYRVYRSTEPGVGTDDVRVSGPMPVLGTSFVDESAEPEVTYYYAVTAVDEIGRESVPSDEAVAQIVPVPDTEAPEAPAALTAAPGDGTVDLTWEASASSDVAGYRVYRSLEPKADITGGVVSGTALLTEPAYTDTAVTNGTTYFYVVTAVDVA